MNTPLYMKSLHVSLEADNRVVIRGHVTNSATFPAPRMRLYISLHEPRGDVMVGRVGVDLPGVAPYQTHAFEAATRLRDPGLFTVRSRLEKMQDVDYSDFDFAMHEWGGHGSGRRTSEDSRE